MNTSPIKATEDVQPIPIKMKMADPKEVSDAVVAAIRSDFGLDDVFRGQAENIWRCVSLALVNVGCVVIQVDNDERR